MSPKTSKWKYIISEHMRDMNIGNNNLYFSCTDYIETTAGLILTIESSDVWEEDDRDLIDESIVVTREFLTWKQIGHLYAQRVQRIDAQKAKRKG